MQVNLMVFFLLAFVRTTSDLMHHMNTTRKLNTRSTQTEDGFQKSCCLRHPGLVVTGNFLGASSIYSRKSARAIHGYLLG